MREKIVDILLECGVEKKDVECRDYIINDLLDSLMMAEVVIAIEDHFGIEIDGDDIIPDNFKNVDTIAAMVMKMVVGGGNGII